MKTQADPLYQHLIVTAERKFWRGAASCTLFGAESRRPRIEAVRIVDMSSSNAGGVRGDFSRTRWAHLERASQKTNIALLTRDHLYQRTRPQLVWDNNRL